MRIGAMIGGREDLEGLLARTQELEAAGFDSVWMPNVFGLDAMGAFTVIGRETERIELGTAVVPTYPRHPVTMAQQALTVRGGFARTLHARHRALAQVRDRGHVGDVVRAARPAHA